MTTDIGTALLGVAAIITSVSGLIASLRRRAGVAGRDPYQEPGRSSAR